MGWPLEVTVSAWPCCLAAGAGGSRPATAPAKTCGRTGLGFPQAQSAAWLRGSRWAAAALKTQQSPPEGKERPRPAAGAGVPSGARAALLRAQAGSSLGSPRKEAENPARSDWPADYAKKAKTQYHLIGIKRAGPKPSGLGNGEGPSRQLGAGAVGGSCEKPPLRSLLRQCLLTAHRAPLPVPRQPSPACPGPFQGRILCFGRGSALAAGTRPRCTLGLWPGGATHLTAPDPALRRAASLDAHARHHHASPPATPPSGPPSRLP